MFDFYLFNQHSTLYFNGSCLGHVINLGNVDMMGHITKIAAVENATAIWEYDPTREDNRVLGGLLDVIAAIQTLAIKVCVDMNPQYSHLMQLPLLGSKRLDSALSTSRALNFFVEFPSR
jgi:hypothetical protein